MILKKKQKTKSRRCFSYLPVFSLLAQLGPWARKIPGKIPRKRRAICKWQMEEKFGISSQKSKKLSILLTSLSPSSLSLSFQSSFTPSLQTQIFIATTAWPDPLSPVFGAEISVEIGVWCRDRCLGVVWRSALGCGFAVGCVGSYRRGFRLRLSAWVAGFFAVEVLTCECRTLCCF